MKTQNVHELKMLEAWDKAKELRYQARMATLNAFVCKMWVVVWLGGCVVLTGLIFKAFFCN
jgi:hypothetical protein